MKTIKIRTALLFIVSLISVASFAQQDAELFATNKSQSTFGAEEQEFLRVEDAYQVLPSFDGENLSTFWTAQPGYYLYQHQFKVELRNADSAKKLPLVFEKGKKKFDEIFNKELVVYYDNTTVKAEPKSLQAPYEIKLTSQACADAGLCYPPRNQYFKVSEAGEVLESNRGAFDNYANSAGGASSRASEDESPLLLMVILGALLGGLILNLMPCVFPVLSLKALSFTSAHHDTRTQKLHGWAYTGGVVGSFLVAAIIILVARGAGESLGWGFQLQQPGFVAFMAYLFFIMGLSLSGLFHIGTQWMGAGQSLTSGEGLKSSFFTGVLAALVASPCTAPFMATALGFALTQPAYISLLIFSALGLGMALPFLLLSYSPILAKYLPAPGPWMDTLKQVLAFPLYITSAWLLWVLSNQSSSTGAFAVLVGAILIAFGIWMLQQHAKSAGGKIFVKCLAAASITSAAYMGWIAGDFKANDHGMWEVYSPENLEELRANSTPVFIDLTADWCITCKFNERVALNTEAVAKFAALNDIVMLQGDWTNSDPVISELLDQFGRSGVPLYLMYPADPNKDPQVLPQILTESIVLESMRKALL